MDPRATAKSASLFLTEQDKLVLFELPLWERHGHGHGDGATGADAAAVGGRFAPISVDPSASNVIPLAQVHHS